jgi:hypothetical protein
LKSWQLIDKKIKQAPIFIKKEFISRFGVLKSQILKGADIVIFNKLTNF